MTNPTAGWYKDPTNGLQQRRWDGETWSDEVRPIPPAAAPSDGPVQMMPPVYRPVRQGFFRAHRALSIIGTVVAFVVFGAIVAAGSGGNNPVSNVPGAGSGTPTTGGSSATTQPHNSHTLSFQDMNGVPYTVDLLGITDPAKGSDQFNTPDAGKRFVAVMFKITDTGHQSTSDAADNNASLIGSDNQTYPTDLSTVAGCTDFNSGQYQLTPGQSSTGCVVFQVPTAVYVKKIEWSPSSGFSNDFGTWNITG